MATGVIPKYQDPISDTGWLSLEDDRFIGTLKYRIRDNIFELKNTAWIRLATALGPGNSRIIAQLPSGYRPTIAIGYIYGNNSTVLSSVKIEGGNITVNNSTESTWAGGNTGAQLLIDVMSFFN